LPQSSSLLFEYSIEYIMAYSRMHNITTTDITLKETDCRQATLFQSMTFVQKAICL